MNKKNAHLKKQRGRHSEQAQRPRRKKGGWILFGLLFVAVAVLLAMLPQLAEWQQEDPRNIVSAVAAGASIDENLRAAGTLLDEDADYISIPTGVELEFVKENGDMVAPGELIATADSAGVMLAIAELQSAMAEIDEKIEDARDGSSTSTLSAPADGRVKAVYAESGDTVSEVMYENGALLLLSLDGKMAVDIAASSVSAGQAITVEFNDGSTADGRVSTIAGSRATVTISDNGPAVGEAVALRDENGELLGSGALYIHSELKITGYYGTIDSLSVSLNEYVYADEELLSISISDSSAAYAGLLAQRQEMERQMQTLFELYQDGGIYATSGGFIAEIIEYEDNQSQSQQGNMPGGMPFGIAWQGEMPTLQLLASEPSELVTGNAATPSPTASAAESPTPTAQEDDSGDDSPALNALAPVGAGTLPAADAGEYSSGDTEGDDTEGGDTEGGDTEDGDSEDSDTEDGDSGNDVKGDESLKPSTAFVDRYAKVIEASKTSLTLLLAPTASGIHYADRNSIAALNYTQEITITPPIMSTVLLYSADAWSLCEVADIEAGDYLILTYGGSGPTAPLLWIVRHSAKSDDYEGNPKFDPKFDPKTSPTPSPTPTPTTDSSSSGEMSSSGIGSMSGISGMSGMGAMGAMTMPEGMAAAEEKYTLEERQVCAITPDRRMTVELSIDELDILALSKGQTVTLHLDALNRDFIGTIEEIAAEATLGEGSPKFLVTVSLQRDLDMRTGMNAAASIHLSTTEAACTLPVEAITELNGRSYVYTGYDEKHDELLQPIAVETGVSDGQTVEILSGIEPGTVVYYEYQASLISPLFE